MRTAALGAPREPEPSSVGVARHPAERYRRIEASPTAVFQGVPAKPVWAAVRDRCLTSDVESRTERDLAAHRRGCFVQ